MLPLSLRFRQLPRLAAGLALLLQAAPAQEPPRALPLENAGGGAEAGKSRDLAASVRTQKEARTMRLSVPAPRGLIVDRNGIALAQNRTVNYLALNFPFLDKASPAEILTYAKTKIEAANRALGKAWSLPDDRLLSHYEHRRWLPLIFSIEEGLYVEITEEQQAKLQSMLEDGSLLLRVHAI
jgi:penicillin-binding protein 2